MIKIHSLNAVLKNVDLARTSEGISIAEEILSSLAYKVFNTCKILDC